MSLTTDFQNLHISETASSQQMTTVTPDHKSDLEVRTNEAAKHLNAPEPSFSLPDPSGFKGGPYVPQVYFQGIHSKKRYLGPPNRAPRID